MPHGDDLLLMSGTKENKKKDTQNDAQDSQQNEQIKTKLDGVGNEISTLLMDQDLSDEDKQLANEMLATVQLTKESTNQEQVVAGDGELLNNQIMDNGEQVKDEQQGAGVLNEQLGEQMGVREVDVAQPSFAVQQAPVPQAPEPAHRKSGLFRFFKSVIGLISGCVVVKRFAKWKHASRSRETLVAARQKADQLSAMVNNRVVDNEQKEQANPQQDAPQDAQKLDIMNDATKAPVVWEKPLGYGAQQPTAEAHAKQLVAGEREEAASKHTFMVLHYSKEDYRTGKERRYRLAFGLYPRFSGDSLASSGLAATVPGSMEDDADGASTIGRSYKITNEQVNTILSQAPKEADKGYNLINHNCTTFVVNMLQSAGISDGGLKEEHLNIGAVEVLMPVAKVIGVNRVTGLRKNLLRKMDNDDYSYNRQEKKLVSYEEMERFENSINYDNSKLEGYGPGMLGEQLRSINARDDNASGVTSIKSFDDIILPKEINAKYKLIDKYGKTPAGEGVKTDILDPIVKLMQEVQELSVPLNKKFNSEMMEEITNERTQFLSNTEEFDRRKMELETAAREWAGKLDPVADKKLSLLSYQLIGEVNAIELEFYRLHEKVNPNNIVGVDSSEKDLFNVLSDGSVFKYDEDNNPIIKSAFAKVFGGQTMKSVNERMNETSEGKSKSEAAALNREQHMLSLKRGAVTDHIVAEIYKFNKFAKQNKFTQEQVNAAFGKSESVGDIEKEPSKRKEQLYKKSVDDNMKRVNAMVILTKLFPSTRNKIDSQTDACEKIIKQSRGNVTQSLSYEDTCKVCVTVMETLQEGIKAQDNDLLAKIIQALVSEVGMDKDSVIKKLYDTIFYEYLFTIVQGALVRFTVMGQLHPNEDFYKGESDTAAYADVVATKSKFASQMEAIVEKVLKEMKEVAA